MNKTVNTNKILRALLLFFFLGAIAFGGGDQGMKETNDYVVGAASIAGLIFIIAINLLWIIFPAGVAFMTYSYFKRKAEQSQEDNGVKAGVSIFFSVLVGFMGAYFIVGNIGKAAGGNSVDTLEKGNEFIVSSFLGSMVTRFGDQLESQ